MSMSATVTIHNIIVVACWLIGVSLALADVVYEPHLAAPAIAFIGAGATLYLKGRLDALAGDWLKAYEAGREVSRIRASR